MKYYYGQNPHVVPVLAPADITTSTTQTDVVCLKKYSKLEFIVSFGVITGDEIQLTVEECDNVTPSNYTAIDFHYRKSSAVGTDELGDPSTATSSGITISASDDNKAVLVDIESSELSDGYPCVRLSLDPGGSMSECVVGAVCILDPRYAREVNVSAVE